MFYTISSFCIVVGFDDTSIVYCYYCTILYCSLFNMCHSLMKQNHFLLFVLILAPMKLMYISLPLTVLSLTLAVQNVRYSVNINTTIASYKYCRRVIPLDSFP